MQRKGNNEGRKEGNVRYNRRPIMWEGRKGMLSARTRKNEGRKEGNIKCKEGQE